MLSLFFSFFSIFGDLVESIRDPKYIWFLGVCVLFFFPFSSLSYGTVNTTLNTINSLFSFFLTTPNQALSFTYQDPKTPHSFFFLYKIAIK